MRTQQDAIPAERRGEPGPPASGAGSDGRPSPASLDALLPPSMAAKAADVGAAKAGEDAPRTLILAVLAGAFIGLGAAFATTVTAGAAGTLPFGVLRLLAGLVFSLGLILVVVAGAELFTGNNLIVIALAERRITLARLLRNWGLVYAGNLAGALATAALVFVARQHEFGDGAVGASALSIAQAKGELELVQAVALGALCNALVCLAVWLCYSARSVADKVLAIVFPISAFVALGFEHSVANMYFLPLAVLIREHASDAFWERSGTTASSFPDVTVTDAVVHNLLQLTAGNVVGGSTMVGSSTGPCTCAGGERRPGVRTPGRLSACGGLRSRSTHRRGCHGRPWTARSCSESIERSGVVFEQIVFGTDGSQTADVALPIVQRLGADGARVVVVHANETVAGRGGPTGRYLDEDELRARISDQVRELRDAGVDARLQVVTGLRADPAHAIDTIAREQGADLIVVGTRGHSRVAGLVVGSVTQQLLKLAPCPVLAVPNRSAGPATSDDTKAVSGAA